MSYNASGMGCVCFLVAVTVAAACASEAPTAGAHATPTPGDRQRAAPAPQAAEPRVIHLPVRYAGSNEDPSCDPAVDTLTVRLAREEQLPEGPQSFAVFDDGGFVVADPLHERLVFYTSDGKFQRSVCVGWAVADVASLGNKQLHIKRAGDPIGRTIDLGGQQVTRGQSESVALAPEPVITSDQSATLRWSARAESGPGETAIELADPARRIASVQVIGVDQGKAYVRLESTEAAERSPTTIGITIRRYSRAGEPEAEVRGIPVHYYIVPTTAFRVVNDVLYQLLPTEKEVLIRVWDLP